MEKNIRVKDVLKKLTEDIYYLPASEETDRPVLAAIVGKECSLVVDAGNSDKHAELFLQGLTEQGIRKPDYLAITHWHWDHVFGINRMEMTTFAHVETQKKVEEMVELDWSDEALDLRVEEGKEIPFCCEKIKLELPIRKNLKLTAPKINFMTKLEVDLGGIHCVIEHVGGDHAVDSSVIYVPERKVLFLGDCLCPDLYNGEYSYSTEKILPLIKKLRSYDVDYYIESHSTPINKEKMNMTFGSLEFVGNMIIKYKQDIQAITRECELALQRKLTEGEIGVINLYIAGLSEK